MVSTGHLLKIQVQRWRLIVNFMRSMDDVQSLGLQEYEDPHQDADDMRANEI